MPEVVVIVNEDVQATTVTIQEVNYQLLISQNLIEQNTTVTVDQAINLIGQSGITETLVVVSNQQGPQGSTGLTGDTGPTGPIGPTGLTGATGSIGLTGPQGVQGIQGIKGDTGDTGTAATIAAGTTTTGSAGTSASVTNVGTSSAAVFNFTVPKGDTGATGPTGPGYSGVTSTTSLTIANSVTRVFTITSGSAFATGVRVRAASAATPASYMEGIVTVSGTTMTMTVDAIGGSGTYSDWNINATGNIGATGAPGGVTSIVAGTNITISPTGGTGAVTINGSASGVTSFNGVTGAITGVNSVNGSTGTVTGLAPTASPTLTGTVQLGTAATLAFEGATSNAFDTTVTVVDPTANRTITLPDASGTVALTGSTVASVNGSTGAVTGIATTAGNLSQFASTTSAQLLALLSDETGTGANVFAGSPTFTGTPLSTTAAVDTNTTQIATTAFVLAQSGSATPIVSGTGTVGTSTRYARQDHIHPKETPTGVVNPYAGATAPTGWLLCDGAAVSRTTYSALFAITSTTYGVGDGTTTFNLPNLQNRIPTGKAATGTFATLGGTGGVETVALTSAESGLQGHSHTGSSGNDNTEHTHSGSTGNVSAWHTHSFSFTETADSTGDGAARYDSSSAASQGAQTYSTGNPDANHTHAFTTGGRSAFHQHAITVDAVAAVAATAHTNLQPYIVLNYIIKT